LEKVSERGKRTKREEVTNSIEKEREREKGVEFQYWNMKK